NPPVSGKDCYGTSPRRCQAGKKGKSRAKQADPAPCLPPTWRRRRLRRTSRKSVPAALATRLASERGSRDGSRGTALAPLRSQALPGHERKEINVFWDKNLWLVYVALAGLAWGTYVPIIFYGGSELGGKASSRFMAILCVGAAYFIIGVLLPLLL